MKSREQWLEEEPKKETYGWTDRGGFDDEQHGWCIEGGEEAYDEACKGWRNRWSHKIIEGIQEAMEKNKVLISVYNNASGFLWSMMMCPGGTDLGGSYQVDRRNTNDAGSFDSWNEAAQDALDLLGDYTLDQFEATRNEHRCSWSEFVHNLCKLEAKKKNTEKHIRD